MELPRDWFIDYDNETLMTKLKGVTFDVYSPPEREIPPNDLNKIEFSLVKYEFILQRHFVAQHNVTHAFFNTESLVSEDPYFKNHAKKMLNFIKSEINYCSDTWQDELYLDHLVHRLDSLLLRTYYFLLQLHSSLIKKDSEGNSPWTPTASLEDMLGHLAVRYPDLVSFIQYFEKAYEELYHKISPLARSYQLQLNLIVAIWTVANMFNEYCFEDIIRVSTSKFAREEEQSLKQGILSSNETFRVEEAVEVSPGVMEDKNSMQQWLTGQLGQSSFINKITRTSEQDSFGLVEKALAARKESTINIELEEQLIDVRTKGNFLERLRNTAKLQQQASRNQALLDKTKPADLVPADSVNGLSSVASTKFSTLGLSSLSSVKESPNNPLLKNSTMHSMLSDSTDEHDLRAMIARSTQINSKQNVISHFNPDILTKLESESKDESKRAGYNDLIASSTRKKDLLSRTNNSEEDDYMRMMNNKLSDSLYRTLIGESAQQQQKSAQEELAKQRMEARTGGFLKSLQKSVNVGPMGDPENRKGGRDDSADQAIDADKSNGDKRGKQADEREDAEKTKKESKKKMMMEEEFLKLKIASETLTAEQQQYVPSKENKGDDIPDEEILNEVIGMSSCYIQWFKGPRTR